MDTKGRMIVDKAGLLLQTNEIDITKFDKLVKLEGDAMEGKIILQPLPQKEVTISGIIIPNGTGEFRCAVIAAYKDSKFKRGDIILLKLSDFPGGMPPTVDFVEDKPCIILFESFIWYKYAFRFEE